MCSCGRVSQCPGALLATATHAVNSVSHPWHCSDKIAISEASESGIVEAYHMKDGYMCFHVPRDDGAALRDIDLLEQ